MHQAERDLVVYLQFARAETARECLQRALFHKSRPTLRPSRYTPLHSYDGDRKHTGRYEPPKANRTPCERHVTFGKGGATRGTCSHAIRSQCWTGEDGL